MSSDISIRVLGLRFGGARPDGGLPGRSKVVAQQEYPPLTPGGPDGSIVLPGLVLRCMASEVERRPCTENEFRNHKGGRRNAPPPQEKGADLGRLAHQVDAPGMQLGCGNRGGTVAPPYPRPKCKHNHALERSRHMLIGRAIRWPIFWHTQRAACLYRAASAPRNLATKNRIGKRHD